MGLLDYVRLDVMIAQKDTVYHVCKAFYMTPPLKLVKNVVTIAITAILIILISATLVFKALTLVETPA